MEPEKLGLHFSSSVFPGARSFALIKIFNEVSNLLAKSLEISRSEDYNQEYRARASPDSVILGLSFSGVLFASPDV